MTRACKPQHHRQSLQRNSLRALAAHGSKPISKHPSQQLLQPCRWQCRACKPQQHTQSLQCNSLRALASGQQMANLAQAKQQAPQSAAPDAALQVAIPGSDPSLQTPASQAVPSLAVHSRLQFRRKLNASRQVAIPGSDASLQAPAAQAVPSVQQLMGPGSAQRIAVPTQANQQAPQSSAPATLQVAIRGLGLQAAHAFPSVQQLTGPGSGQQTANPAQAKQHPSSAAPATLQVEIPTTPTVAVTAMPTGRPASCEFASGLPSLLCKPAWPTTESVAPHGQFMKRDVTWGRMFRGGVREQRMC